MDWEPDNEADKWRMRERAMLMGVVAWTVGFTVALRYRPSSVDFIFEASPGVAAGTILICVGIFAGLGHLGLLLANSYVAADEYDEDLTEWDA